MKWLSKMKRIVGLLLFIAVVVVWFSPANITIMGETVPRIEREANSFVNITGSGLVSGTVTVVHVPCEPFTVGTYKGDCLSYVRTTTDPGHTMSVTTNSLNIMNGQIK